MRQKKLLFALLLVFSACSIFAPKQQSLSDQYVTGLGLDETNSEEIIFHLKRDKPLAGGNYQLEIVPRTAYLNLVEKVLDQNDKTCFDIKIVVREFPQANNLEKWKIKFSPVVDLDADKDYVEATWNNVASVVEKKIAGPSGTRPEWTSTGTACVSSVFPLENGFKLKIFPNFIAWPFPESESIDWKFDRYVLENGKVELKEKGKPSNYKSYRGW